MTVLCGMFLAAATESGFASLSVSLSCSANPQALPVEQTVTFYVSLSGLSSGQQLSSLSANVAYSGSLLDSPTIAAGAIVPSPLYTNDDFLSGTPESQQVEAIFSTFGTSSAYHIRNDGVFFSFNTAILTTGTGTMSFSWADGAQYVDSGTPMYPITVTTGTPLSLRAVIVPEPNASVMLLTAAVLSATLIFGLRFRRK